jgi:serine/threonine protein kinase
MGTVWSAVEDATGEPVAIKIIALADHGDAGTLLAEARRAATVDHPGVVRVRDHGGTDDAAWIVMDLIEGRDLRRYVDENGPFSPREAARIVADAADALAAVHAAGLVHRDVKPANVLLDESGDTLGVRLADFGIAARLPPEKTLTETSEWVRTGGEPVSRPGTYVYMAPEQWRGGAPSERGDVYGLGGVLYTALTGERPYPHEDLPQLAYAAAVLPPPRAADAAPGLPRGYDDVIAAAMAKDPETRIGSARELGAALRAVADGRTPALPRRASRSRLLPIGSAVLVLAGLAAAALAWHPWSAHSDTPRPLRRIVCAQDLELRDGPRGSQTGMLRHGDIVRVYHRDGSQRWAYVHTQDGRVGWVLGTWVRPACP